MQWLCAGRTCADPYPLYSAALGSYARVLSEPASKLVCGGLQHWESFVINLLGGNARTYYILAATRKSKRGEFLTRPDYFCDFWLGSPARYIALEDLSEYQWQCAGILHGTTARRREMSLRCRARATHRLDLEYGCSKPATSFYGVLKEERPYQMVSRFLHRKMIFDIWRISFCDYTPNFK